MNNLLNSYPHILKEKFMLFRKNEKSVAIEVKETSNDEQVNSINEQPQICMFNTDKQIFQAFSEQHYNCTEASIGTNVIVPNKQRYDQHIVKLNHHYPSNLHEFDILVFDMGTDDSIAYEPVNFNSTGNINALVSTYPEKLFNPKPFIINILSKEIQKLLQKESIVIIFADQMETVQYHPIKITASGNQAESPFNSSNTGFYKHFPNCFNKAGRKIQTIGNVPKLDPILSKYASDSHYEIVFHHPTHWNGSKHEKDNDFIPLLLNNDNEIISFIHAHEAGIVFVFPQIHNKKDFLLELFSNYLPEIFPKLFPNQGQFNWLNNSEYLMPDEIDLLSQKDEIERKFHEDIEAIEKEFIKTKEKYSFLKNLLFESGENLVRAVEEYFKWLDFESIINLDDTNPEIREEDLQVDCGERFLVVEIKGIGGTSTDKDCSQISKIRYRRAEQRGKFDVFGLYVVNHQRYMPPESRQNPPFSENQIKDAELDKRGLLTTYELFKSYFMIKEGILEKEDVRNQLFNTGLIQLHPSNLKSLGVPEEYFSNNEVIILNLDNTLIKKEDFLIAKKGNHYTKLKIQSIMLNDNPTNEAYSGEVGVKVDKKVRKKSEIFTFLNCK